MKLSVNGVAQKVDASPGSYAMVERIWKEGDKLEVEWPLELRTEMLPHSREWVAVLYGPIVLAGKLGTAGLEGISFHDRNYFPKKLPFDNVPVFLGSPGDILVLTNFVKFVNNDGYEELTRFMKDREIACPDPAALKKAVEHYSKAPLVPLAGSVAPALIVARHCPVVHLVRGVQRIFLTERLCPQLQGFLLSAPLAAEEFGALLRKGPAPRKPARKSGA